jgi:Cu-Zn family superoxide dismutase
MRHVSLRFALPFCASLAVAAPAHAAQAHAVLKGVKGTEVGKATIEDATGGVLVRASFTALPSGVHAFHIHAVGQCDPPFTSAQGHFNPGGREHGFANPKGWHAGDMPSLHVPDSGTIAVDVYVPGVTLDQGDNRLLDGDGAALMIHAGPDDYRSDPTGNAGERIACGVVTR